MNKQFLIIIAVVVLGLFGVLAYSKQKNPSSNQSSQSDVAPSENKIGKGTKGVTLTEYGDFQCPACGQYYPLVEQVRKEYGDQITFQFRSFPLVQIHPNAFIASRAAEAAAKQGKFFEMYNLLYENQQSWSSSQNATPILESYAQELGLNLDQFKEDMKSPAIADIINADKKSGDKLGVEATPTFFINGEKITNPTTLDEFKKVIDEAIAKQKN